jgi:hypothetical protein
VERLTRFLYSRRSIVGSLLALGGLALHFVGLLGGILWLPIVIGLYLIGVLLIPSEPQLSLALDASADADEIRRGLDRLVHQIKGRVAPDIQARVESIRDSILATLAGEGGRAAGDPTVLLIRQTALDYLPSALTAYLALPRAQAERRAVAGGRTPHAALLDQLDLMDAKMHEASDAILAHDSEKLLANGRFLADKFAVSSLRLDGSAAESSQGDGGTGAGAVPAAVPSAVPVPDAAAVPAHADVPVAERERARP